jgi:hypothetical protein
MDDPSVLKAEGRDREAVLIAMTQSETDSRVLQRLPGDVYGCRLRDDLSIRVLEKIVASPHISEKNRREAAGYLEGVRERAGKRRPARSQSGADQNQPMPRVTPVR